MVTAVLEGKLPPNWPAGLSLPPGTEVIGSIVWSGGGFLVFARVSLDVVRTEAELRDAFAAAGWEVTATRYLPAGPGTHISFRRGEAGIMVQLVPSDGGTELEVSFLPHRPRFFPDISPPTAPPA